MKAELRRFIQVELLNGRSLGDSEDILVNGLVDSMGVMRLVAYIEQQFGLKVPPDDLTIENFRTIEVLTRYLEGRQSS